MACYCKVRQLLVTIKFEVLAQIGRLKPDIQIILQSWPKGFGRHFLFHMFLLVWNLQLTDKTPSNRLTNAPPTPPPPPRSKLSSITCSSYVKGVWILTPNTVQGGGGLASPDGVLRGARISFLPWGGMKHELP